MNMSYMKIFMVAIIIHYLAEKTESTWIEAPRLNKRELNDLQLNLKDTISTTSSMMIKKENKLIGKLFGLAKVSLIIGTIANFASSAINSDLVRFVNREILIG